MPAPWTVERPPATAPAHMSAAERALAESNQRYRSLFAYNPHAAFSLDLQGHYEDANPAAERLAGYSLAELRTMVFTTVIHPDDLPEVAEAFLEVLARRPQQLEARILNKDGVVVELSLTAVPVVVCDEVVGVHGIAEDVTERNELRRQLEQARRVAEQASVTKSLFLANMSHEVRTPLTSVLAATEMLADADLPPEDAHFVEIIERSGERLLRLVNDILDFSRLEAGRLDVHDRSVSVPCLATEVAGWARAQTDSAGLGFDLHLDPRLPTALSGDSLRISQVLTNLLDNAVKFTDEGRVSLSVELAELTSGTAHVRFEVTDTGIGIPSSELPTLFESFTQGDPSSTRRYGGAGLGLAISQELVALMGGTLSAESTPGAGSTFGFTLPLDVV